MAAPLSFCSTRRANSRADRSKREPGEPTCPNFNSMGCAPERPGSKTQRASAAAAVKAFIVGPLAFGGKQASKARIEGLDQGWRFQAGPQASGLGPRAGFGSSDHN